jgi:hypothetical protein
LILLTPPALYVAVVAIAVIFDFTHPTSIVQWLLFDLTAAPWSLPPRGLPVSIGLLLNLGISVWVGVALADLVERLRR